MRKTTILLWVVIGEQFFWLCCCGVGGPRSYPRCVGGQ